MNLRNVLRAYSLLRVLSDEESALLETLRAANDNERQLIAEAMADKSQKKSSKKSAGGGRGSSKSARASGMAKALNDNLSQRRQEVLDDIAGAGENAAVCTGCNYGHDHNIHHHENMIGYHSFQPVSITAASSGGG